MRYHTGNQLAGLQRRARGSQPAEGRGHAPDDTQPAARQRSGRRAGARRRAPHPPRQYRPGRSRHVENRIMSALVRAGLVPRSYLLTTRGRKTGRPPTNPVVPVDHGGRRWLIAPYGAVSWVHNARAAGRVSLTRRRDTRDYTIREASPDEAGPILQRYVRIAPSTRRYFRAAKDSRSRPSPPDRHPVFELTPAGADRPPAHPGR